MEKVTTAAAAGKASHGNVSRSHDGRKVSAYGIDHPKDVNVKGGNKRSRGSSKTQNQVKRIRVQQKAEAEAEAEAGPDSGSDNSDVVVVERARSRSTKVSYVIFTKIIVVSHSEPHSQTLSVAAKVVDLSGTATSAHDAQQRILAFLLRSHMHFESVIEVSQVIIHTTCV